MTKSHNPTPAERDERFSLYGLDPEKAIEAVLQTPPNHDRSQIDETVRQLANDHPEWLHTVSATCKAATMAERDTTNSVPEFTFASVRLFDQNPSTNMRALLRRGLIERSPKGNGRKAWYVMPYRVEVERAVLAALKYD